MNPGKIFLTNSGGSLRTLYRRYLLSSNRSRCRLLCKQRSRH